MSTKIADVIVPEVFNPYVVERTAELAAMYFGGMISTNAELNRLATSGGTQIKMPFWNDLTGPSQSLSDAVPLTVGKIGSGQDLAALITRGNAWGVNDLADALSGERDAMRVIGDLVSSYWARDHQSTMISTLNGVFADNVANDAGDMELDVSIADGDNATTANLANHESFIDAAGTMGDAHAGLAGIMCHSVVAANLRKQKAVSTEKIGDENIRIELYLGKYRLIEDDSCPRVAGGTSGFVYDSYLFGNGAMGLGNGAAKVPTETDRDSLLGEDILINRRHFLLHPRGVAWTGTPAGVGPTDAELAVGGNWDRVYERKNVRFARLRTNG